MFWFPIKTHHCICLFSPYQMYKDMLKHFCSNLLEKFSQTTSQCLCLSAMSCKHRVKFLEDTVPHLSLWLWNSSPEREMEKLIDKRINKCTFTVNTKQGSRRSNNHTYSAQYPSTHRHCKRLFKVVVWHQVILKILWKTSLNMASAGIIPNKTHGWFNIRS